MAIRHEWLVRRWLSLVKGRELDMVTDCGLVEVNLWHLEPTPFHLISAYGNRLCHHSHWFSIGIVVSKKEERLCDMGYRGSTLDIETK